MSFSLSERVDFLRKVITADRESACGGIGDYYRGDDAEEFVRIYDMLLGIVDECAGFDHSHCAAAVELILDRIGARYICDEPDHAWRHSDGLASGPYRACR